MQVGINIIRRALEEPLRQIAQNAGYEGAVVVAKVRERRSPRKASTPSTRSTRTWSRPASSTRPRSSAPRCRTPSSIASLLLTTEALVSEIPEEKPEAPQGGGHGGGGGMGGMYYGCNSLADSTGAARLSAAPFLIDAPPRCAARGRSSASPIPTVAT